MGISLSSPPHPTDPEKTSTFNPKAWRHHVHYIPVPAEASTAPEDSNTWYDDFFEQAVCVPHSDGESIIIFDPVPDDEYPDPRVRPDWAIKRLRKAYQLLDEGHPRIARLVMLDYV